MSNRNDTAAPPADQRGAPGRGAVVAHGGVLRERYGEGVELTGARTPRCAMASSSRSARTCSTGASRAHAPADARVHEALRGTGDVIPLLRTAVEDWQPEAVAQSTGTVLTVEDGIATVSGLPEAFYGEILLFSGGVRGMVQNLERDEIGCILFGDDSTVEQGSPVYRTNRVAGIPVGEGFLGRVVDALGSPIDGGAPVEAEGYRPVESPAPDIIARQPVNRRWRRGCSPSTACSRSVAVSAS